LSTAKFYLDTSVIVSAYLPDIHTSKVLTFLGKQQNCAVSLWGDLEFRGALGVLVRQKVIAAQQAEQVLKHYQSHRQAGVYVVTELNAKHYQAALDSFPSFEAPLKSADALHVGIAKFEKLTLVTLDDKQAKVAKQVKVNCLQL
jgi:predicted nucleic acid-binding protein